MTKVIIFMLLLLPCFPIYSQTMQKSERFKVYFELDSRVIDPNFRGNSEELQRISELLEQVKSDPNISMSKIEINSYASPEGGRTYNQKLTRSRSNAVYNYLLTKAMVADSLICKTHSGVDWAGLYDFVDESHMEHREEILDIIRDTPEETWRRVNSDDRWLTLVDSRLKCLQDLKRGNPYRYMGDHFFPLLRSGSVITVHTSVKPSKPIISSANKASLFLTDMVEPIKLQTISSEVFQQEHKAKRSLKFALKTNLLANALLAPNIELEVPIGDRWSVAGEWLFPWWVADDGTENSSRNRLQILNANLEGKYWFGSRSNYDTLTGWYCGLYSGAGLYDVEYKAKGYQGEFFIAAGLSGGYAHTINKSRSLRMEYSLAMGYLKTEYRGYESIWGDDERWHPVKRESGIYTWFGPTRARVSLAWMIGNRSKRGGALE